MVASGVALKGISIKDLFLLYTRLSSKQTQKRETKIFIIDLRAQKKFSKGHLAATPVGYTYCIRATKDGQALVDYSKASYPLKWTQECWWGCDVVVYDEADVDPRHPVIQYLLKEQKCASLRAIKGGFAAVQQSAAILITNSITEGAVRQYPSPVVPGEVYLGSWSNAADVDRLKELGITRVVTIHNDPQSLQLPSSFQQLPIELPDTTAAQINKHFDTVFKFIEDARNQKKRVLVHCGSGVSRSPTLVLAYLLRKQLLPLSQLLRDLIRQRPFVSPNVGFMEQLRNFETSLGIKPEPGDEVEVDTRQREEAAAQLHADVAGTKVTVQYVAGRRVKRIMEARKQLAKDDQAGPAGQGGSQDDGAANSPRAAKRSKPNPVHDRNGDAGGSADTSAPEQRDFDDVAAAQVQIDVYKDGACIGWYGIRRLTQYNRVTFGREASCNVQLEHESISRLHAELKLKGGKGGGGWS